MGEIGAPELIIILVIIIILFGPGRLQGAGRALGEAISGFRRALRDEDTAAPPAVEPARQAAEQAERERVS
jgi:sec-independent protein translocase protein TatA